MPSLTPRQIEDEVRRNVGRGLEAGAIFFVARLKEVLSVPAPRRRVLGRDGAYYYRATTKAIPGAPPRKLSGFMRSRADYEMRSGGTEALAGEAGVPYARRHEYEGHPYLAPTLAANLDHIGRIVGEVAVR